MYIGANNYELYTPEVCDGGLCCRDCYKCPKADKVLEWAEKHENPTVHIFKAMNKDCEDGEENA